MEINLKELLPFRFRDIREFQQIMKAHEEVLGRLEKHIDQIWGNCYIQTADANTIGIYEGWLDITCRSGDSLEFRRQRIMQLLNIVSPFSVGYLRKQLTDLFGTDYSISVDPYNSKITVVITSSRYGAVDLFYSIIWDIIPAHLEVAANHRVENLITGNVYAAGVMGCTVIQTIESEDIDSIVYLTDENGVSLVDSMGALLIYE